MAATGPDPKLNHMSFYSGYPPNSQHKFPDERLRRIEWKLAMLKHMSPCPVFVSISNRAYLYKFKDRFIRGQGPNTEHEMP